MNTNLDVFSASADGWGVLRVVDRIEESDTHYDLHSGILVTPVAKKDMKHVLPKIGDKIQVSISDSGIVSGLKINGRVAFSKSEEEVKEEQRALLRKLRGELENNAQGCDWQSPFIADRVEEKGKYVTISGEGIGFFVSKEDLNGVMPQVGDKIQVARSDNHAGLIRAIKINDKLVAEKTKAQLDKGVQEIKDAAERAQLNADVRTKQEAAARSAQTSAWQAYQERAEENYAGLPPYFRRQIDSIRKMDLSTRMVWEEQLMFHCLESFKIAQALKTSGAILKFQLLYEGNNPRFVDMVPTISSKHNERTIERACKDAVGYLKEQEQTRVLLAARERGGMGE